MRPPCRHASPLGAFLLAILLTATPSLAEAPVTGFLGGVARDVLGRGIEGVEILVLAAEAPLEVRYATQTDASGHFFIEDLPRGPYRLAALKPGYLAAVAQVDTALRATFDFVLRPAPKPGEVGYERVRESLSWILRTPARSILRETDPAELLAEVHDGEPAAGDSPGAQAQAAVEGRFQHLVAVSGLSRGRSGGASLQGGETSMQLAGTLGGRGSLSVAGQRRRIESVADQVGETLTGKRDTDSLLVDFSYDTGPDAVLDVKAYFARDGAELVASAASAPPTGREAHTSWGYDATWTKQLDRASRMAVQIGFVDATLEVSSEGLPVGATLASAPNLLGNLSNRAAEAEGLYESMAGDAHTVRVAMRAQLLDLAVPLVRGGTETMFLGLPGAAGLAIRIDAEDAWTPFAAWTMSYGIGVHQAIGGADSTLLIPRAGIEWAGTRWHARGSVAYHDVASSPSRSLDLAETGVFRPEGRWGYEGEVEAGVGANVRVRATAVYDPVQDGQRSWDELAWADGRPLFLRGGNASDRFVGLAVERHTPRAATYARWREGRSAGLLADVLAYDLPLRVFSERAVRYSAGGLGARFPTSGTDLSLDYRRLRSLGIPAASDGASDLEAEYVEMSFGQRLVRLPRSGASCQLVVAARASTHRGSERGASLDAERARDLAALNDRISAGLVVAF